MCTGRTPATRADPCLTPQGMCGPLRPALSPRHPPRAPHLAHGPSRPNKWPGSSHRASGISFDLKMTPCERKPTSSTPAILCWLQSPLWMEMNQSPSFTEHFHIWQEQCTRCWGGGCGGMEEMGRESLQTPLCNLWDVNRLNKVLLHTFQDRRTRGPHYKAWRKKF